MNVCSKLILVVFCLVSLTFSFSTLAQTDPETFTAKNAIYLEVGGSSGRYAVNFSKIFYQKEKLKLNVSAGFSMWRSSITTRDFSSTKWLPVVPLEFSALWGKANHHLEMGVGFTSFLDMGLDMDPNTYELSEKVAYGAIIPLRVGYRYQKPEGGFFFRIGYTPIIDFPPRTGGNWSFNPYHAGVSFGKSF